MRSSILATVLIGCTPGTQPPDEPLPASLSLNDVSILFPLPASDAERARFLWLLPRAGEQGPYFPANVIGELPQLNADVPDALGYPAAMITSLRFDPCFPRLGGDTCQAQLRLVAQPVLTSADGVSMLEDAAAHLFYSLSPAEADAVVATLAAIRARSPVPTEGPLGVHPGLAADLAGRTGESVRALVVDHCRDDNLIRITANTFAFDNWGFARFDRVAGAFVAQELPAMAETGTSQAWLRQAQPDDLDDPSGAIAPEPSDGFTYLLASSSYASGAPRDPIRAGAAAARVVAIEDPTLTSTEDVDCASCHLATQTRLFAARNGVAFSRGYDAPEGLDTTLVLEPELAGNLGATISFGYHMQQATGAHLPSISQRTVNESAAIAAFLRAR